VVTAGNKLMYFRRAPIVTINSASGNQVECADSELGAFFRKLKTRKGPASEATATARIKLSARLPQSKFCEKNLRRR